MERFIEDVEKKVLNGQAIGFDEAIRLTTVEKKEDITKLCDATNNVREFFCGKVVDLCTIMNAKSGHCSEDCKFCAQSEYYNTNIKTYELVSKESALKLAKENEAVKKQVDNIEHVIFANFSNKPAIELAEKLVAITPDTLTKVFFSDNGSSAVEIL